MLLRPPPSELEVGGKRYPVDADFRHWMRFARVLESGELANSEKAGIALYNTYGPVKWGPAEAAEALERAVWFYQCGEEARGEPARERLLDWERDGAAVWADFMLYFRIDLRACTLHWWEFMALFRSLPGEAEIKFRIRTRALDLSSIKDSQLREQYRRQKESVALDNPTEDWEEMYERMGG